MKNSALILPIILQLIILSCSEPASKKADFWNLAVEKKKQLRLSTYVTAQTVKQMFSTESGRREALSLLRCYGITKVYL
jgi:hypothetical protein